MSTKYAGVLSGQFDGKKPFLIVGTESDEPFAIDIGAYCRQRVDIADIVSLKTFVNTEFCPRFISDEQDMAEIGNKLAGTNVVLVSTVSSTLSRNELAWRTLLIARAAKDNGAAGVVLVEPDLFFSAQDRGPRPDHGDADYERTIADYKKFDGQPFTSLFYAQALALAGVDCAITVHNHSGSVQRLFEATLNRGFLNLSPADVFADYILKSDVTPSLHNGTGLLMCAPDLGARAFVSEVDDEIRRQSGGNAKTGLLWYTKRRTGERSVSTIIDDCSPCAVEDIAGRDVIVIDDMVRTGTTIRECCRQLKAAGAGRVVYFVTHFYSSPEARENLSSAEIDEIVTTNTLPLILNRDMQGRLRRKMTVIKIEKWISRVILDVLGRPTEHLKGRIYNVDMSTKNPRAHPAA